MNAYIFIYIMFAFESIVCILCVFSSHPYPWNWAASVLSFGGVFRFEFTHPPSNRAIVVLSSLLAQCRVAIDTEAFSTRENFVCDYVACNVHTFYEVIIIGICNLLRTSNDSDTRWNNKEAIPFEISSSFSPITPAPRVFRLCVCGVLQWNPATKASRNAFESSNDCHTMTLALFAKWMFVACCFNEFHILSTSFTCLVIWFDMWNASKEFASWQSDVTNFTHLRHSIHFTYKSVRKDDDIWMKAKLLQVFITLTKPHLARYLSNNRSQTVLRAIRVRV